MAKILDTSRDHASVWGDTEGRRFQQDGAYFRADGSEWIDPAARPPVKAPPAKPARNTPPEPMRLTPVRSATESGS